MCVMPMMTGWHCDGVDNCPLIANSDQANADGDRFGDVCDADDDGDGIADGADNCPLIANSDQANADGDRLAMCVMPMMTAMALRMVLTTAR